MHCDAKAHCQCHSQKALMKRCSGPISFKSRTKQEGQICYFGDSKQLNLIYSSRHQIYTSRLTNVTARGIPRDYPEAIRQAQSSTKAALSDRKSLIEIEFPAAGLTSVSGDGEGANEMTYSLQYLRQFCRILQDEAAKTRIFFPDQKEMLLASEQGDAVFGSTKFQLDYLTRPSFLHDIGLGALDRIDASKSVQQSDKTFVIAYPHFNIGEMVAVKEVYDSTIQGTDRPLIIFNGELDRIRSGYYPSVFYPGLAKMAKEWLPQFCTAFYIHNFKGRNPGVLYRAYPGRWQVFRRKGQNLEDVQLIHEQDEMPSLKTVSLEILSN